MNTGAAIFWFVVLFGLLIASIWQAVQGDWAPAIFLALLWHGFNNNLSVFDR